MGLKRVISSFSGSPEGLRKFIQYFLSPGESLEEPIFIVGPPRSGTTLLNSKLLGLPDLCGPLGETGFFMFSNPYKLSFPPIEQAAWEEIVRRSSHRTAAFDAAMFWFKSHYSANFFIEKTPQHCLSWRNIQRMWPKAKFLAIIRHPLDCVASASQNRSFIPQGRRLKAAALYWNRCAASVSDLRENATGSFVTSYESLTSDKSELSRIYYWITNRSIPENTSKRIQHTYVGRKGFELLDGDVVTSQIGRWPEVLDPTQADLAWKLTREVASKFGYCKEASSIKNP